MKMRMMDLLLCPHCRESLELHVFSESGNDYRGKIPGPVCRHFCHLRKRNLEGKRLGFDCTDCFRKEITEGLLTCRCGRYYPIIGGIPRMLPDSLRDDFIRGEFSSFLKKYEKEIPENLRREINEKPEALKKKTLESFGFQWTRFPEMFHEFRANFLNYIRPIKPGFFRGKLSLDLGCGFGRHTYYAAEFGSEVVGLDLSNAVEAAYKNTRKFPHSHIIQGDIYNLPLRNDFDFLFSIGVIHHLPDPKGAFLNLVKFAGRGSSVFVWLYGREGRWFKIHIVEGVIRRITRKLPHGLLYYLCYIPAGIYQINNDIYNSLRKHKSTRGLAEKTPFRGYAKFPFRVKHADAFDLLATPVNNYYTREEVEEWLRDSGLSKTRITGIDGRSWRAFGVKG